MSDFLPICREDMIKRGWEKVDFVYVTGDAYVDHPSFGVAIISRVLEDAGYKVGIISQPDWKNPESIAEYGKPELGFFVTSGNIDSMVAHYTVAKKKRTGDAYTPGGKTGKRPDRALTVYCKMIREKYPDIPIIIGGLEASLRRFAHYDYWDNKVKPSVLFDTKADLLSYGMGEKQTLQIAQRLKNGENISDIHDIKGTCYLVDTKDTPYTGVECPSLKNVTESKKEYALACRIQMDEQDHIRGKLIKQRHFDKMLIQNPPMEPLTRQELDHVYSLDYMRNYHPSYEKAGGVPGISEVKFSVTHNRGCFGACNFCSLAFHQGRYITSRSKESVLSEIEKLTKMDDFKGYIHDIGGPTANFRYPSCEIQEEKGLCRGRKCLAPKPCANIRSDHREYLEILREARKIKGVKKVFIRSGIRFDYLMEDKDRSFMYELIEHHISGQLKVAPEHCSAAVLDKMGKPHIESYKKFADEFYRINGEIHKKQYLVPYLMSSHPGSTIKEAVELALFLKRENIHPEQVQDFYPTPGTVSTCMYYTELDPYTMEKVYVAKNPHEKAMQRALLQYFRPENRELVKEALILAGRRDLMGNSPKCLISSSVGNFNKGKNRYGKTGKKV